MNEQAKEQAKEQAAEPYIQVLAALIEDLEIRSNLKRGEDKGLVDCSHSIYEQAKQLLKGNTK